MTHAGSIAAVITPIAPIAVAALLALSVSGCVTEGQLEPDKWDPADRARAHVDLGMIYLRRNQLDIADSKFELAIEIDPRYSPAWHAKGLVLAQTGKPSEASTSFARAIALDPVNYLANNDYAVHLCRQGEIGRGIELLERIDGLAANDQQLGTRLGLGVCQLRNDNPAEAEKHLQSVLRRSPSIPQALLPMAEIRYDSGNYLSARGFLERYFGTGALSERSLYLATRVEVELNDVNKANQYRRELRRRFPLSEYITELEALVQ